MESQKEVGRREFLGAAAAALFAGISITVLGCNDDKGTGSGVEPGDMAGDVSDNHPAPHKVVLKKAQIDAGGAVTLHIQGASGHDHTVSLTADHMIELKKPGGMVTVTSSTTVIAGTSEGHAHDVMFM